ncbi:hypothetical protein NQZ68_001009 [Dissostichus eleginoides]|nr:hypothetical protein NQZ68_001009 [Dissostichus eleginoides]
MSSSKTMSMRLPKANSESREIPDSALAAPQSFSGTVTRGTPAGVGANCQRNEMILQMLTGLLPDAVGRSLGHSTGETPSGGQEYRF